ncbi:MAG: c-type cytochrome [Bryobacteraceae bacterium]
MIAIACLTLPALAQPGGTTRANPFTSARDVAEGARFFQGQCAACHGPQGVGGAAGPDLTTGEFKLGDSDEVLFEAVAKGIPGTPMPAYAGDARAIWQIVAYTRSLGVGKAREAAKGDADRGARIFRASACLGCHSIGSEGATIGPDLSAIGSRRSLANLQRSIVDPGAEVAADFWTLRARTRDGRRISGIRLNEDTYSYQFRSEAGLRAVLKSDLAEHEIVRTSPMPPYDGKLATADLDDLVAYLASLQGGSR